MFETRDTVRRYDASRLSAAEVSTMLASQPDQASSFTSIAGRPGLVTVHAPYNSEVTVQLSTIARDEMATWMRNLLPHLHDEVGADLILGGPGSEMSGEAPHVQLLAEL